MTGREAAHGCHCSGTRADSGDGVQTVASEGLEGQCRHLEGEEAPLPPVREHVDQKFVSTVDQNFVVIYRQAALPCFPRLARANPNASQAEPPARGPAQPGFASGMARQGAGSAPCVLVQAERNESVAKFNQTKISF